MTEAEIEEALQLHASWSRKGAVSLSHAHNIKHNIPRREIERWSWLSIDFICDLDDAIEVGGGLDGIPEEFYAKYKTSRNILLRTISTIPSVYFVTVKGHGFVKVGYTNSLTQRLSDLQVGCPYELEITASVFGSYNIEQWIHRHIASCLYRGEWYEAKGIAREAIDAARSGGMRELAKLFGHSRLPFWEKEL